MAGLGIALRGLGKALKTSKIGKTLRRTFGDPKKHLNIKMKQLVKCSENYLKALTEVLVVSDLMWTKKAKLSNPLF